MTMLDERLANLGHYLRQAEDPLRYIQPNGSISEHLWTFAFDKIQDVAEDLEKQIEELRQQINEDPRCERAAWESYRRVRTESENVFRECLDLVGGLALRDHSTDGQICQLADELIYECSRPSFKVVATMPAQVDDGGDSLTSTLRRVANVRFPDWTVWTVPLVAYEYAHVMTDVEDLLKSYVTREAASWSDNKQSASMAEETAVELSNQATAYARVLLADAFATFTMGPSYACAALLLRLDPADPGHRYRPSDGTRARMILGVLEAMDARATSSYREIRDYLTSQWQAHHELVPQPDPNRPEDVLAPASVAAYLQRRFKHRRTGYSSEGWNAARGWSERWKQALEEHRELVEPDLGDEDHSLRDALNAAWECRIWASRQAGIETGAVNHIGSVGRRLCDFVVKRRGVAGRGLPPDRDRRH